MNIVLWIIQILLSLLFLFAGSMKFIMSAEQMNDGAPVALPIWFIHFIGICEILGAIGLVVPWLTRIKRGLTPLAASLLIVIMIGATVINGATLGVAMALPTFVLGVLAAFVAYGRTRLAPQVAAPRSCQSLSDSCCCLWQEADTATFPIQVCRNNNFLRSKIV